MYRSRRTHTNPQKLQRINLVLKDIIDARIKVCINTTRRREYLTTTEVTNIRLTNNKQTPTQASNMLMISAV